LLRIQAAAALELAADRQVDAGQAALLGVAGASTKVKATPGWSEVAKAQRRRFQRAPTPPK
jgi:hypothetical protein